MSLNTKYLSQRRRVLERFVSVVCSDSAKARALIKQLNFKNDAYLLCCIALTYHDESLFKPNGQMRRAIVMRKWRLAEKYALRAYDLEPECTDVLWVLGLVRKLSRELHLAISYFEKIVSQRKERAALIECTDLEIFDIKQNDSRFQLYRLYHEIGEARKSRLNLALYKKGLSKGIPTLYTPLENFLMS